MARNKCHFCGLNAKLYKVKLINNKFVKCCLLCLWNFKDFISKLYIKNKSYKYENLIKKVKNRKDFISFVLNI